MHVRDDEMYRLKHRNKTVDQQRALNRMGDHKLRSNVQQTGGSLEVSHK